MGNEPVAIMRAHFFRGQQKPDATVLVGRSLLHKSDRTQAGDELVDVTAARHAVSRQSSLQKSDGEPGFALCGILCSVKNERNVVDEESACLDEQPHDKPIAAV
jgi:hypothetical protein